jgi:hypothetical protein
MVALNSSRRQNIRPSFQGSPEALAAIRQDFVPAMASSRRKADSLAVVRDPGGAIQRVRIGPWRFVSAGPQRRIAEVKQLPSDHVAVRIERFAEGGPQASSEIWQLYDLQGRLEAAMQTTPDGNFAVLTNYRTRQVCRMERNGRNELEAVETWSI